MELNLKHALAELEAVKEYFKGDYKAFTLTRSFFLSLGELLNPNLYCEGSVSLQFNTLTIFVSTVGQKISTTITNKKDGSITQRFFEPEDNTLDQIWLDSYSSIIRLPKESYPIRVISELTFSS